MKVIDLFNVYSGSKLDFAKQVQDDTGINFVSRNSNNNGVVGKVLVDTSVKTYKAGDITVPLGGSYLLTCFMQDEDFVTAQNVAVLRAKVPMTALEKWFYCYALRENRFKFSAFGREVNKYIKDIELPNSIPVWVSDSNIDSISTENNLVGIPLNTDTWKYFPLSGKGGIFGIEPCKCSNAVQLLEDGDDIDYIGAKKDDNGVMRRVKNNDDLTTRGNCIIFICDGQGSVGYTNYIESDFIGSTTLSVGRNSRLTRHNALFLVAVLDRERYRYSFGRKYKTNLSKARVLLPAKDNAPDWDYMERYIKSLPYGDKL
jgi:hypothetical protein